MKYFIVVYVALFVQHSILFSDHRLNCTTIGHTCFGRSFPAFLDTRANIGSKNDERQKIKHEDINNSVLRLSYK